MAHAENMFETYAASSKSAFDYWISFFPTAPMFGVDWRFGEFVSPDTARSHQTEASAIKKATKVAKSATKPVDHIAPPSSAPETAVPAQQIVLAPKSPAKPKPLTKPVLLAEKPASVDPLTQIKGVGPGLEKQLHELGIYTFAQLSDLNEAQLEWLDQNLRTVKGRCIRDDWSGQAKALRV